MNACTDFVCLRLQTHTNARCVHHGQFKAVCCFNCRVIQRRRALLWGSQSLPRGGAELAALGVLVLPSSLQELLANRVLVTGFLAWFAAQFGKVRGAVCSW